MHENCLMYAPIVGAINRTSSHWAQVARWDRIQDELLIQCRCDAGGENKSGIWKLKATTELWKNLASQHQQHRGSIKVKAKRTNFKIYSRKEGEKERKVNIWLGNKDFYCARTEFFMWCERERSKKKFCNYFHSVRSMPNSSSSRPSRVSCVFCRETCSEMRNWVKVQVLEWNSISCHPRNRTKCVSCAT